MKIFKNLLFNKYRYVRRKQDRDLFTFDSEDIADYWRLKHERQSQGYIKRITNYYKWLFEKYRKWRTYREDETDEDFQTIDEVWYSQYFERRTYDTKMTKGKKAEEIEKRVDEGEDAMDLAKGFYEMSKYGESKDNYDQLFQESKIKEDLERIKRYKEDPDFLKKCYSHDENTPLLNDSELTKKYLSKLTLTTEEELELKKILDKRREIMDRFSIYDFDLANFFDKEIEKYENLKQNYPNLYNFLQVFEDCIFQFRTWKAWFWRGLLYLDLLRSPLEPFPEWSKPPRGPRLDTIEALKKASRSINKVENIDWEHWKIHHGIYRQADALGIDGLNYDEFIKKDFEVRRTYKKAYNTLKQSQMMAREDRYAHHGETFDQVVSPYGISGHSASRAEGWEDYFEKPDLMYTAAGNLIQWHNFKNMTESNLLNAWHKYFTRPLWTDDLYGENKRYYLKPPRDYIMRYKLLYHRSIVNYQELWLPRMIEMCREIKSYKTHETRIEKSWNYVLDKNVSMVDKVKKFIKGDLWLQSTIDPSLIGGWGEEYEKHLEGKSSAYDDTGASAKYNYRIRKYHWIKKWFVKGKEHNFVDIPLYENPALAEFENIVGFNRKWDWINPTFKNNKIFLTKYWRPWLEELKKHNRSPYGTEENPDIFWFKFVKRDIIYLRKADGSRLDQSSFDDWWLLRQVELEWERLWLTNMAKAKTKAEKQFFYLYKNWQVERARLPAKYLPDHIWVRKFRYDGPKLWEFLLGDFNYITGKYSGPLHLPAEIRYAHWYQCMRNTGQSISHYLTMQYYGAFTIDWIPVWLIFLILTCCNIAMLLIFAINNYSRGPIQLRLGQKKWNWMPLDYNPKISVPFLYEHCPKAREMDRYNRLWFFLLASIIYSLYWGGWSLCLTFLSVKQNLMGIWFFTGALSLIALFHLLGAHLGRSFWDSMFTAERVALYHLHRKWEHLLADRSQLRHISYKKYIADETERRVRKVNELRELEKDPDWTAEDSLNFKEEEKNQRKLQKQEYEKERQNIEKRMESKIYIIKAEIAVAKEVLKRAEEEKKRKKKQEKEEKRLAKLAEKFSKLEEENNNSEKKKTSLNFKSFFDKRNKKLQEKEQKEREFNKYVSDKTDLSKESNKSALTDLKIKFQLILNRIKRFKK